MSPVLGMEHKNSSLPSCRDHSKSHCSMCITYTMRSTHSKLYPVLSFSRMFPILCRWHIRRTNGPWFTWSWASLLFPGLEYFNWLLLCICAHARKNISGGKSKGLLEHLLQVQDPDPCTGTDQTIIYPTPRLRIGSKTPHETDIGWYSRERVQAFYLHVRVCPHP